MTSKFARALLVAAVLLALSGMPAFAYDLCSTQSLSALVTAGGCYIGDKVFSNFATFGLDLGLVNDIGDPTTGAANVTVSPLGIGIGSGAIGLNFFFNNGSFTVADSATMVIQYTVDTTTSPDALSPYMNITSVYTQANGGIGDSSGTADIAKDLCVGAAFNAYTGSGNPQCGGSGSPVTNVVGGYGGNEFFLTSDYPNTQSGTISITPTTYLGVADFMQLNGGNGGAEIDQMTNQFNQEPPVGGVPEPATLLLLGSALVGLGVLRRKRL